MHPLNFFSIIGLVLLASCEDRDQATPTQNHAEHVSSFGTEGPNNPQIDPIGSSSKRTVTIRADSLPYITVRQIQPEAFAGTITAPARVDFRAKAVSAAGSVVAGRVTKTHAEKQRGQTRFRAG